MPPSKINPETTYDAFSSTETLTQVAKRLGLRRPTLARWWIAKFGEDAYKKRTDRKLSVEEKRENRRQYREANKERIRENRNKRNSTGKVNAAQKRYRDAHKKEIQSYQKHYYEMHGDRIRERERLRRTEDPSVRERARIRARLNPEKVMLHSARVRARKLGLPFDITIDDVRACVPKDGRCPITGEQFVRNEGKGGGGPRSMSLDRIFPHLGYVRGNIAVISHLANTLKNNCTDPAIFERLAVYIRGFKKGE